MNTFEQVANWNLVCGKSAPEYRSPEYYEALRNQCERIAEELKEVTDALDLLKNSDHVTDELLDQVDLEILDGGCDLDVVVSGLNFLAGHNYTGAIQAVLENNNAKYTHLYSFAQESLAEYGEGHSIKKVFVEMSAEDGTTVDMLKEAGYDLIIQGGVLGAFVYSVHRDSDDKICKLKDHPKVSLHQFLGSYVGQ